MQTSHSVPRARHTASQLATRRELLPAGLTRILRVPTQSLRRLRPRPSQLARPLALSRSPREDSVRKAFRSTRLLGTVRTTYPVHVDGRAQGRVLGLGLLLHQVPVDRGGDGLSPRRPGQGKELRLQQQYFLVGWRGGFGEGCLRRRKGAGRGTQLVGECNVLARSPLPKSLLTRRSVAPPQTTTPIAQVVNSD